MKKLIDIFYFIKKNANFKNEKELYINKNYTKLKSNNNILYKNNNDEIIFSPSAKKYLPKIFFTPLQNKNSSIINYNDIYNNPNNLCIKRKLLENSLSYSRNKDNKNIQNKSYSSNGEKNSNNKKVFFPILKANNNIKENTDNSSSLDLYLNEYNINNDEKNKEKNDEFIDKYLNILSIKPVKPLIKIPKLNNNKISDKNNSNKDEDQINIYNSKIKFGKLFNIKNFNNIADSDKFTYKYKYLFLKEKNKKLNNIFNASKSVKILNDKVGIIKPKINIKINSPNKILKVNDINIEKNCENLKLKENHETDILNKNKNPNKKIIYQYSNIITNEKKEKSEKIINNSFCKEIKLLKNKILTDTKVPNNIIKISNNNRAKKNKMETLNKFPNAYESLDVISKKYLSKKICNYALNIVNINAPIEKYYYTVNKMYIRQLPEYMQHRINWELIDIKSINLEENKNININFQWKYLSNRLNFKKYRYDPSVRSSDKKYCMVNLFERNYEIGNKRNMFKNLISYCDNINLNVFDFVPFTTTVNYSKDIDIFLESLNEIMNFINNKKNINNDNQNLIINRKYNEQFWFDKNYNFLKNQYININKNFLSEKNYWIIKPPDLYQGKCIEISNNFDEINKTCKNMFKGVDKTLASDIDINSEEDSKDENNTSLVNNIRLIKNKNNPFLNLNQNNNISSNEINLLNNSSDLLKSKKIEKEKKKIIYSNITCFNEVIIQKYLDNPLLYKKRKFDIRCYVLVDSNLNVFFCREGHLKGSSEFYDINTKNKFIHITNHSLQKKSSKFEQFEYGNEMSYNDFKNFMEEENIPISKFTKMLEDMKFLVKISLKSVGKKLLRVSPVLCFEIFGYDFILDNDFRPWILEINNNPGLGISSPVIQKLVPRMLDDAFRLTIDKVFETKYSEECIDRDGKYKSKYKLEGFDDSDNLFEFLCNVG